MVKNRAYAILLALGFSALGLDQMVGYDTPQAVGAAEIQNQPAAAGAQSWPPTAAFLPLLKLRPVSAFSIRHHISKRLNTLNESFGFKTQPITQAFMPDASWINQKDLPAAPVLDATQKSITDYAKELSLKGTMKNSAIINGYIIDINQKIKRPNFSLSLPKLGHAHFLKFPR